MKFLPYLYCFVSHGAEAVTDVKISQLRKARCDTLDRSLVEIEGVRGEHLQSVIDKFLRPGRNGFARRFSVVRINVLRVLMPSVVF